MQTARAYDRGPLFRIFPALALILFAVGCGGGSRTPSDQGSKPDIVIGKPDVPGDITGELPNDVADADPSLESHSDLAGQCEPDKTQECSKDIGECTKGLRTCQEDGTWGPCSGQEPSPETCDDLDNDCNEFVDDGLFQECGLDVGECKKGLGKCVAGVWGDCEDSIPPSEELCDDLDNDCDGLTDEELVIPCDECDVGICKPGKTTCEDGTWGSCLCGDTPAEEICDTLDNDCDGETDEDDVCYMCFNLLVNSGFETEMTPWIEFGGGAGSWETQLVSDEGLQSMVFEYHRWDSSADGGTTGARQDLSCAVDACEEVYIELDVKVLDNSLQSSGWWSASNGGHGEWPAAVQVSYVDEDRVQWEWVHGFLPQKDSNGRTNYSQVESGAWFRFQSPNLKIETTTQTLADNVPIEGMLPAELYRLSINGQGHDFKGRFDNVELWCCPSY